MSDIRNFQVSDIPMAMDKMGWRVSSALMRHWFKNGNDSWTNDYKILLNTKTDALALKISEYNDTIVTMKWAMQFEQVNMNIQNLIQLVNNLSSTD